MRALREAAAVYCEDTRRTQQLLNHYQIHTPTLSYHEHNEMTRAPELVIKLAEGNNIALVSDAGMPVVSDPGFRLVHLAVRHAIPVIPVPGASAFVAALAASGGHRRMEHVAHKSVSLKIGVIAGMLSALMLYWLLRWNGPVILPKPDIGPNSAGLLLGLLITVQGFETSRYLGLAYEPELRIRTMRYAQWLSSAIYIAFLLLLTPLLGRTAHVEGVAGIMDVMEGVAPYLSILVLVGAVSSQLSAAVADSIGSAGLVSEVSDLKAGFLASAALAVTVVWLTDPFQVVALASRSFAVYYTMQCLLAFLAAGQAKAGGIWARIAFVGLGAVSFAAAAIGSSAG
jgi:hypothetical protein